MTNIFLEVKQYLEFSYFPGREKENKWREKNILMAHVSRKRHVDKYVFSEF